MIVPAVVTGLANVNQIGQGRASALEQRNDVMNFFAWYLETTTGMVLTQAMAALSNQGTDLPPLVLLGEAIDSRIAITTYLGYSVLSSAEGRRFSDESHRFNVHAFTSLPWAS